MVIDLKPLTGRRTACIYGFPTAGKTSVQRCFRFLSYDAKIALGIDPSVHFDLTDTDEYFGVFKMSEQDAATRDKIANMMWKSIQLATSLKVKESHISVILTNFNHRYDGGGFDNLNFIAGFIPADEESVRDSLKKRQPQEYDQEIDRYLEWYRKAMESPLAKYLDERGLLVRMRANEHMLDYIVYDGIKVPFVDIHIRASELPNHRQDTIL